MVNMIYYCITFKGVSLD